jgi:hypothetical protein
MFGLAIFRLKDDQTIMVIDRKISQLDIERVKLLLSGGYHLHKNPKKRSRISPEMVDQNAY